MADHNLDPKFLAGVKLLERTGARRFRIAHSPEEDGDPPVWYATATWNLGAQGRPVATAKVWNPRHEAAGALDPVKAVMRLCEYVIDGGECTHCRQSTIFDDNPKDSPFDAMLNYIGCVYAWDPELKTFRRGCEGEA